MNYINLRNTLFLYFLFAVFLTKSTYAQEAVHVYNTNTNIEKLFEKSDKAIEKGSNDKALAYLLEAKEQAAGNVQVLDKLAAFYYAQAQKMNANKVYGEIESRINNVLASENDLSEPVKAELQLILDLATKRIKELDIESNTDMTLTLDQVSAPATQEESIFDMVDADLEKKFLTGYKPFRKGDSYEQQVEQVKQEVEEQYIKLSESKDFYSESIKDIQQINNDWLKHSAFSKLEWFSGLKVKEKAYLESLNEYRDLSIEKDRLLAERTIIMGEIRNIQTKVDWEEKKREELQLIVDKQLKDELKGKLTAIPKSIVLVGRTVISDQAQGKSVKEIRSENNNKVLEAMQKKAIEKAGGYEVSSFASMQDNELNQFFSTTAQGTAQTIDNYYKDLNPEFARENKKYTYLISRIEVFPYNKNQSINVSNGGSSNVYSDNDPNTNVYSWDANSAKLVDLDNGSESPYAEHKFKQQEKDYLDFQTRFSNSLNDKYKEEIVKAGKEYQSSLTETRNQIERALTAVNGFNNLIIQKRDSLGVIEKRLSGIDQLVAEKRDDAIRQYNLYKRHYETKNSQVNKLVIQNSGDVSVGGLQHCIMMVDKTLAGIDDIRKESQSLVVYKQVSQEGESIGAAESTVQFKPELRRFRILSLHKFEDTESGDVYNCINIAYDVGWIPVSEKGGYAQNTANQRPSTMQNNTARVNNDIATTVVKKNSEVNSELNAAIAADADLLTPNRNVVVGSTVQYNQDGSVTLLRNGKPIVFKLVNEASSKISYLYSQYVNQWRLPSVSELEFIFKEAKVLKGSSDDFINNKFVWQSNSASFLTDETVRNLQNEATNTCIELLRSNYSYRTEELLDDEEVFLLLIKK